MKQKTYKATAITDKQLNDYLTKKEFKERISKLEKDLGIRLSRIEKLIIAQTHLQHEIMKDDLNTRMSKFTNMILTAIDPMIKYIDERREEKEIEAHQLHETRTQLSNHEKRIKKLEQS